MNDQSKKITIRLLLGWLFGLLFALTGLAGIISGEPIPGIVMFIMAAALLPPVIQFVDRKWKFHLSGGLKAIIIIVGFVIFGVTIETPTSEVQQINQSASEIVQEKLTQEQPKKYDLSEIDYKIVKTEDFSFASATRFNIRVLMGDNPTTKEQIRAVSEKIVGDYQGKADAVSIVFYFEKSQVDGAYTLAKADWAPNGDWSQADLKTNQKLVYDFKDIVGQERKDGPTAEERDINQAMKEMMETTDFVTDEDVAIILAPQYGKTVDEMLGIRMKVTIYDLGL